MPTDELFYILHFPKHHWVRIWFPSYTIADEVAGPWETTVLRRGIFLPKVTELGKESFKTWLCLRLLM